MPVKDPEWAEGQLKRYLWLVEKVPSQELTKAGNPRMVLRGTDEERAEQRYVAWCIYDELFQGDPPERRYFNSQHVRDALAEVRRGAEISRGLGSADHPTLDAARLHPWVWSAAEPHWVSDAHRAAVWAAGINVNSRLQTKLGRKDLSEAKLIEQAFSTSPPTEENPRLRLCDESNPDLFRDMHVGAITLGQGLYMGVRNVVNHVGPEEHDLPEQEALECLAAFSLLARWIDRAEVENGS